MSDLLDHALKEKYNSMKINDPLLFVKNAKYSCKDHDQGPFSEHVQYG
jgi:hypothetical protein